MPGLRAVLQEVRRLLARYRRVLGAILAGAALIGLIESLSPAAPASTRVVVAAHNLAAGTSIDGSDVRLVAVPPGIVPSGATDQTGSIVDRVVAGPIRAGEVITDVRLVGAGLLARYPPGLVAAPVRVSDPGAVALLEVGDRIDVFAARSDRAAADLVVADAPVLALPEATQSEQQGGIVVIGVSASQAADLAGAGAAAPLSFALLR